MRNRFARAVSSAMGCAFALVILGTATVSGQGAAGQAQPAYRAPRAADGRPNLNGIWQAMNAANWDLEAHGPQSAPYPELVGVYLAQPGGLSVVEGWDDSIQTCAGKEEGERESAWLSTRDRDQGGRRPGFLPGVRVQNLHALSVFRLSKAESDPDHLRVREHQPARAHGKN